MPIFHSVYFYTQHKIKVPFSSVITCTRHYYRHLRIAWYLPNFYQYFLVSPHSIINVLASLLLTTACVPLPFWWNIFVNAETLSSSSLSPRSSTPYPQYAIWTVVCYMICDTQFMYRFRANRIPFRMQGRQHNRRLIYRISQRLWWDFWKHTHWSTNFKHAAIQWLQHSNKFSW